jgi:hypothetical protein
LARDLRIGLDAAGASPRRSQRRIDIAPAAAATSPLPRITSTSTRTARSKRPLDAKRSAPCALHVPASIPMPAFAAAHDLHGSRLRHIHRREVGLSPGPDELRPPVSIGLYPSARCDTDRNAARLPNLPNGRIDDVDLERLESLAVARMHVDRLRTGARTSDGVSGKCLNAQQERGVLAGVARAVQARLDQDAPNASSRRTRLAARRSPRDNAAGSPQRDGTSDP